MHNILTITFNPCIDKNTSVNALAPEKKLRCSTPVFEPGGGGINVARAINKLGGSAIAVYPSGGYSGKFLDVLLQYEKVVTRSVETKNHTRENLIVLDKATNQQYRFGMPGQELLESEWKQCLQIIEDEPASYIIVSGSIPSGVPLDIIARIAKIAHKKSSKLVIDTSGEALELAMKEGSYLVKPNIGELSVLAGRDEMDIIEIELVAKEIVSKGKCEIMVVSMGNTGAMLITKNEVYKVAAPIVKKKSTVGAGDSMVAGIVLSLSRGNSLKESLEFGVACGTAATMNMGTELCKYEDVKKLLNLIRAVPSN